MPTPRSVPTVARVRAVLLSAVLMSCAAPPASTPTPPTTPDSPAPPPVVGPAVTTPLAWSALAASPTTLYEGQGAAAEGRLYVIGGFDHNDGQDPIATAAVHAYDPTTDTWTTRHDAPEAITHAGVAADGAYLYVAGGFIGDHPGPHTDHVWRYDTRADTWTAMPPLPGPRGAGVLVRVGRSLHYFGGTERNAEGSDVRDDADHFVLSLDAPTAWHTAAPLPTARNHLGATVLDGLIYAVGGQHLGDEAHGNVTEVDRYDPATDTWTSVAPLPFPLGHVSASTVVWDSKVLAIGGVTTAKHAGAIEGEEIGTVLAYDPATNTWSALTPLPGPRQSPVADTIGGALIVTTGSTAQGPVDDTWRGH